MLPVAVAIVCKTPKAGLSKTRLSPPLTADECADLSACFIRDVAASVQEAAPDAAYAAYTPPGSEPDLQPLLPQGFHLLPQAEGDLGVRMLRLTRDLFAAGHRGVVLIGADSPTLPRAILHDAVAMTGHADDNLVISPAHDGGYTLIGLTRPHDELFTGIAWSSAAVYAQTRQRALDLRLPVIALPLWYDVDDEESLSVLERELAGQPPPFAAPGLTGAPAHHTRRCLADLRRSAAAMHR